MCDYLREMIEQGKEYWIEQGFKQGIDQGKEQWIEQGIEKGLQKGAFGTLVLNIKSLIDKGRSFDEACYLLDVDDTTKERIRNSEILLS